MKRQEIKTGSHRKHTSRAIFRATLKRIPKRNFEKLSRAWPTSFAQGLRQSFPDQAVITKARLKSDEQSYENNDEGAPGVNREVVVVNKARHRF